MSLLSKARKINGLLQKTGGHAVSFMEMAELLRDVVVANIFVVSRKGKILGYGLVEGYELDELKNGMSEEGRLPEEYNEQLKTVMETSPNLDEQSPLSFNKILNGVFNHRYTTVIPINGGGERLGTLLATRFDGSFTDDDLVLAEYGATVVGIEILQKKSEQAEEKARNRAMVQLAVGSLSYSELEAIEHIFEELDGREGLLVASKIADRVGITRSVIVNALRKLESAGVIESRSLGMKGTYLRILNENLLTELEKLKK